MSRPIKIIALILSLVLFNHFALGYLYAANSIEDAISQVVSSLEKNLPPGIDTIAIWKIENPTKADITFEVIDNLELSLINSSKFKLVDRTRLSEILRERQFSLSGLVDPEKRKRIGEVSGVDAFLYGDITDASTLHEWINDGDYYTSLNLKLLDVKTGTILWQKEIQGHNAENIAGLLGEIPREFSKSSVEGVAENLVSSLGEGPKLGSITTLAVGNITGDAGAVNLDELYRQLDLKIANSGRFKLVDRRNIDLLLSEQRLSMEGITEQSDQERKIGKLWGIDGLIYGTIPRGRATEGEVELRIRVIDVNSGVLIWGDRVRGEAKLIRLEKREYKERVTALPGRTKKERVTSIPGKSFKEHVSSIPEKPKMERIDSIPGKGKKPEAEVVKKFKFLGGTSPDFYPPQSSTGYYLGGIFLVIGLVMGLLAMVLWTPDINVFIPVSGDPVAALVVGSLFSIAGVWAIWEAISADFQDEHVPIPENIEYNRQIDAEIVRRNEEIDRYNAEVDEEIAAKNREIDAYNESLRREIEAENMAIDAYNAQIDAEIVRMNREIDQYNASVDEYNRKVDKINVLLKYLRAREAGGAVRAGGP
jgi:curli biogenesis system outer membrane secretion channel CsgG